MLNKFFKPYESTVDIDELSTKHYNLIGINETSAATRKQISMEDVGDLPPN